MKKILRFAWILFCILLLLAFLISCCSAFISPAAFSYMPLFALFFPYLFAAVLAISVSLLFIHKKSGILMLISLSAGLYNLSTLIAFNLPSKSDNKKKDSSLSIMTWNVQDFVDLTQRSDVSNKMLQLIATQNPDILCLQEVTNVEGARRRFSVRNKLDSMGYKNYYLSNDETFTNKSFAHITRGCAIFSKLPFTDSSRIFINKGRTDEHLIYVDINFSEKPLRIYTAHLASFALFLDTAHLINKDIYEITYDRKRAIQYKLRDIEKIHSKEVSIIRNEILKANLPVIYCGDMNTVPASYTYHSLKDDLQDAFLEKGSGIGATFYKIAPTLRIDYIFVDKRLKVGQCKVIQKKLSDHYPVVTDIEWK